MSFCKTVKVSYDGSYQQFTYWCYQSVFRSTDGSQFVRYGYSILKFDTMQKLESYLQGIAREQFETKCKNKRNESRDELQQPQPQPSKSDEKNSKAGEGIMWLIFLIAIWPVMLIFILIAGLLDLILFILSLGLCFGKCKDKKRTWCSYACTRKMTLCSSQMVVKICKMMLSCHCCFFMAIFTLPLGLTFTLIAMAFDLVAWLATGFYCGGYCCHQPFILQPSLIIQITQYVVLLCIWLIVILVL